MTMYKHIILGLALIVFLGVAAHIPATDAARLTGTSSFAEDFNLSTSVGSNELDCIDSHCSVIATYWTKIENIFVGVHTTMSMDTLLDQFGITGLEEVVAGEVTTFTIPIDASGEIVGHALSYWDSPPIFFEPNGVVRAITEGLDTCINEGEDAHVNCSNPREGREDLRYNITLNDVIGTWEDTWQVFAEDSTQPTNDIVCVTENDGLTATCTTTVASSGTYRLELQRSVDDMELQVERRGTTQSVAPFINTSLFQGQPPTLFPAVMKNRVTIEITPEVQENTPAVAEAGMRINASAASNSVTVIQGQSVNVRLTASEDVTGDGQGSRDPDGWANQTLGMSQGGRCEWNADLDQGSPFSFEHTVLNPATPNACDVELGSITFNDSPGTYTYSLLRLADAGGDFSNTSSVTVTVLPPDATPTPVPPTTSPDVSPSPTTTPLPECSDTQDNDGDGTIDCADNGCWVDPDDSNTCDPLDNSEFLPPSPSPGPFQEED